MDFLAEELPENAPFWSPQVSLGMVVKGQFYASHKISEKEVMLWQLLPEAEMIVATWHGQYRSDLFTVSRERALVEKKERARAP